MNAQPRRPSALSIERSITDSAPHSAVAMLPPVNLAMVRLLCLLFLLPLCTGLPACAAEEVSGSQALPDYQANRVRYFAHALTHHDPEVRRQTIEELQLLDHHELFVAGLVEPLSRALRQPETREDAAMLLEQLGEPAIPAFAPLLDSDQQSLRITAAIAMLGILSNKFFPHPRDVAAPEDYFADVQGQSTVIVLDVLKDPNHPQWNSAVDAAQHIPKSERYRAVDLLLRALHQGHDAAATGLGRMKADGLPALVVAMESDRESVREAASDGLRIFAAKASERHEVALEAVLPVLRQAKDDPSRRVSNAARNALTDVEQQLTKNRPEASADDAGDDSQRQASLHAVLSFLGIDSTDPEEVIPELTDRLYGRNNSREGSSERQRLMQHYAAQTLAALGEPARTHLLDGLKQEDAQVRSMIIEAIGDQQPDFQEAVPLLIDALRSKEDVVRKSAAIAIGKMQPTRQEWLPLLDEALATDARGVPLALAKYGPAIAPRLLERIGDPDDPGADAAAKTFVLLEPPPGSDSIESLIDLLGSENEQVLHRARQVLTGGWRFTQLHILDALDEHPDPQVRRWIALSLRFGHFFHSPSRPVVKAAPAVPALLEALEDPDREVRIAAAHALAVVAPGVARWSNKLRQMAPMLADAALDRDLAPALAPAVPIRVLGEHADAAIPQMVKLLPAGDQDAEQFLIARGAAAVPALRVALSEDELLRRRAIEVIRRIGSPANSAAPELLEIAQQGDSEERLLAARALATVGAAPEVALETVREALEEQRLSFLDDRALDTLVQLVGFYPPAVPDLASLITKTEEDREVGRRQWVVNDRHLKLLGKLAPDDPELVSALQQVALGDGTREAAFIALQQINPAAASEIASDFYKQLADKK